MIPHISQHVHFRPLNPGILREYDIRGLVDDTLTVDDCDTVGRALATIMQKRGYKRAVVGYDGRLSSPAFSSAVRGALARGGIDVIDVGLGPSPMVYFSMKHLKADFAVVITGSHSPITYNGIKVATKDGPFYGDDVQEIGRVAQAQDFVEGEGSLSETDVREDYIARLRRDYTTDTPLNVVWDCGNGAAGEIVQRLVKQLPGQHVVLFGDIDGTFPNHHPDPTVDKNLIDLQREVASRGFDLGVAFDGDADRFGAIDENGRPLRADILMAIFAGEILENYPGAPIIADVKSSRVLFDEIKRLGGVPVMHNTGHSLIKAKMAELNAPLAGELAGHICFNDKFDGFDDGVYCAIRLLDMLARQCKRLSQMTAHLPIMQNTPEVRFHVDADRKFLIAPEIRARLEKMDGIDVTTIDGVRVTTPDGWWLIRASNTEDVLTIRAEGFTAEGLERLKVQVVDQLALSAVSFSFD